MCINLLKRTERKSDLVSWCATGSGFIGFSGSYHDIKLVINKAMDMGERWPGVPGLASVWNMHLVFSSSFS